MKKYKINAQKMIGSYDINIIDPYQNDFSEKYLPLLEGPVCTFESGNIFVTLHHHRDWYADGLSSMFARIKSEHSDFINAHEIAHGIDFITRPIKKSDYSQSGRKMREEVADMAAFCYIKDENIIDFFQKRRICSKLLYQDESHYTGDFWYYIREFKTMDESIKYAQDVVLSKKRMPIKEKILEEKLSEFSQIFPSRDTKNFYSLRPLWLEWIKTQQTDLINIIKQQLDLQSPYRRL